MRGFCYEVDSQYKTLSNLYNMDQLRNNMNVRPLIRSNTLHGSSTMSKEQRSLRCHLALVNNKQEFIYFGECVWVKKLVNESMIHFLLWNISTLTENFIEIVDTMVRTDTNFVCLQEGSEWSKNPRFWLIIPILSN